MEEPPAAGRARTQAALAALPIELIEQHICRRLSWKDRTAFMGASAALWRRSDMAGSGALWGDLDLNWKQDLEPPERQLSLAAWLGRRTAGLRRLRLDGPLPHLGQLLRAVSGSGLRGLVLEDQAFADGALAHLPRLPSLTRLVLSSCQLRGVPPSLTALATNLRDLDVGSNWLQLEGGEGGEGVWAPLSHLQALTRLNASYCGLEGVPQPVSALTQLQELVLEGNNDPSLGALGAASFEPLRPLAQLRSLSLAHCRLAAIPAQLAALQLESLCLQGCSELGPAGDAAWEPLRSLTALTRLDVTACRLASVPRQLAALTCLQELSMPHNGTLAEQELPWAGGVTLTSFTALQGLPLRSVDLRSCRLRDLPPSLAGLVAAGVDVDISMPPVAF